MVESNCPLGSADAPICITGYAAATGSQRPTLICAGMIMCSG